MCARVYVCVCVCVCVSHDFLTVSVFYNREWSRPHHWVTPFLREDGQTGSSKHEFAASALLPDLSTPLKSLSNDALKLKLAMSGMKSRETECKNGTAHTISYTQP